MRATPFICSSGLPPHLTGASKSALCPFAVSNSKPRERGGRVASKTCEDFGGVTLGLNLVVDLLDLAAGRDDEGSALDAHHLLAVHVLLFVDTVGFGRGPVLVRQQGERQIVLLFEFRQRRGLVRRDPDDRRALPAERLDLVAELAGRSEERRVGKESRS